MVLAAILLVGVSGLPDVVVVELTGYPCVPFQIESFPIKLGPKLTSRALKDPPKAVEF